MLLSVLCFFDSVPSGTLHLSALAANIKCRMSNGWMSNRMSLTVPAKLADNLISCYDLNLTVVALPTEVSSLKSSFILLSVVSTEHSTDRTSLSPFWVCSHIQSCQRIGPVSCNVAVWVGSQLFFSEVLKLCLRQFTWQQIEKIYSLILRNGQHCETIVPTEVSQYLTTFLVIEYRISHMVQWCFINEDQCCDNQSDEEQKHASLLTLDTMRLSLQSTRQNTFCCQHARNGDYLWVCTRRMRANRICLSELL